MPFRDSLDISGYRSHYADQGVNLLDGASTVSVNYVREGTHRLDPDLEPIPARLYKVRESTLEPLRLGEGPVTASSSRVLVTEAPTFAWDVNGYYRRLDIAWPYVDATRRDLMRGYQRVNGQASGWITYAFKQLLDPVVRAEYDRCKPGKPYFNDTYVQDQIKAAAAAEAGRRSAEGTHTTFEQILDDWGMVFQPEDLDDSEITRSNEPTPETTDADWGYSHYQWKTYSDVAGLSQWQVLIGALLSDRGVTMDFAVGWVGGQPVRSDIITVDHHTVFMLHESLNPSPETAGDLIARYAAEHLNQ